MRFLKVILSFSRNLYNDLELIAKAVFVKQHMTDNPHFLTPNPLLDQLSAAIATFTLSVAKAENGSKEDTIIKNNDRLELESILQQLGLYVQTISNGAEDIIASSGFDLRKNADPVGPLDNPTGLVISYGKNSGQIIIECVPVKNAVMYEFQYTESPVTPDSVWTNLTSTKHKINVSGLSRSIEYTFRVAGMNSDPSRNWSELATKLVV